MSILTSLREEAVRAPTSGIVEVFNYGRTREGLIPLWVGEGDLPTPGFIVEAAQRSLSAGETFYTYQRGLPDLRAAIADMLAGLYGASPDPERIFVTSGGMHAMQTAFRIVAGRGDEVLVPTPAWPNFVGAITVSGAEPVSVPMSLTDTGWVLDPSAIEAAITPRTRALVINSPANPTGWTADLDTLKALLAIARRHELWIVADEIYGRFLHDPALAVNGRAPSFHDIAEPDERILYVQTFSKNWAMTGWRIGWLEAPVALGQIIENLIQYSSSGTPVFIQRGAIAAVRDGEGVVREQIERARRGREIVCGALSSVNSVVLPPPPGAFYAFPRIVGTRDSNALAMALVDEANVGVAPGATFGPGGEDCLRLCFARDPGHLEEAVRRLVPVLRGKAS